MKRFVYPISIKIIFIAQTFAY